MKTRIATAILGVLFAAVTAHA
ncbi:MAG: hypothetical protein QOK44_3535, partial [Betaproteobacteria bacterium]|nr:hypothetical protein [Betaproteobacteria bacterium]